MNKKVAKPKRDESEGTLQVKVGKGDSYYNNDNN